jgi:hypothetical protein
MILVTIILYTNQDDAFSSCPLTVRLEFLMSQGLSSFSWNLPGSRVRCTDGFLSTLLRLKRESQIVAIAYRR